MKVLVACEESQTICVAFRERGHEAYSCDIQPCSIFGHPDWHIQADAEKVAYSTGWDLMIAHPPCTYLSACGARWMFKKGILNHVRLSEAMRGRDFFLKLMNAPIPLIAIENPTPLKVVGLPVATQAIQPYMFGEPYSKRTLLWLKGLPQLRPTNILDKYKPFLQSGGAGAELSKVRGASRSRTFNGIAIAMAEQWGNYGIGKQGLRY